MPVTKKKPTKRKVGRPKWKPSKKQLTIIKEVSGHGLTDREICSVAGIKHGIFYQYKRESQQFSDLIDHCKNVTNAFVKSQLMDKIAEGNMSAIIFWLRTRCRWTEKIEIEGTVVHAIVTVPPLLEEDQWKQLAKKSQELRLLGQPKQDPKHSSSRAQRTKSSSVVLEAVASRTE